MLRGGGQETEKILEGRNPMVRTAEDNQRHQLRDQDRKNMKRLMGHPVGQGNLLTWTTHVL